MRRRILSIIGNTICFYLAFVICPTGWIPHFTGMNLSHFHALALIFGIAFAIYLEYDERRTERREDADAPPQSRSPITEEEPPFRRRR